ncbi:MAG: DUF1854 domain-containing protein [Defluviitaleaceae bacterium]|nr:DUF1854 domain-containing protein [Defluviitaleaceae bacterium]
MPRYIDGTEIKLKIRDRIFLDAEFFNGESYEALEPHRLFPVSGQTRYVALMDAEGNLIGIINNIDELMPESKDAISSALSAYYLIPKINKIVERTSKQGIDKWTVETSHGKTSFEITDVINSIKKLYDDRVLIKDSSDNRYEISDINQLDKHSMRLIMPDM